MVQSARRPSITPRQVGVGDSKDEQRGGGGGIIVVAVVIAVEVCGESARVRVRARIGPSWFLRPQPVQLAVVRSDSEELITSRMMKMIPIVDGEARRRTIVGLCKGFARIINTKINGESPGTDFPYCGYHRRAVSAEKHINIMYRVQKCDLDEEELEEIRMVRIKHWITVSLPGKGQTLNVICHCH